VSLLETSAPLAFDSSNRPDAPLGTLLFRAGLVPEDKLRQALDDSINEGRRLGEVLLERGLIEEHELARILASQKGLPYLDLTEHDLDQEAVRLLPEEKARHWGALAIRLEETRPVVAVSDPADRHIFGQISTELGCKPRFVVATPSVLARLIPAAYNSLPPSGSASVPPLPRAQADTIAEPPERPVDVILLLSTGERLHISTTADKPEALAEARRLIETITNVSSAAWPLVAGRYVRPDAIISIDIVETAASSQAPHVGGP